jgi:hypothetical protein
MDLRLPFQLLRILDDRICCFSCSVLDSLSKLRSNVAENSQIRNPNVRLWELCHVLAFMLSECETDDYSNRLCTSCSKAAIKDRIKCHLNPILKSETLWAVSFNSANYDQDNINFWICQFQSFRWRSEIPFISDRCWNSGLDLVGSYNNVTFYCRKSEIGRYDVSNRCWIGDDCRLIGRMVFHVWTKASYRCWMVFTLPQMYHSRVSFMQKPPEYRNTLDAAKPRTCSNSTSWESEKARELCTFGEESSVLTMASQ